MQAAKSNRKIIIIVALIILVITAITFLIFNYTYSEGNRAGVVVKFSKKGLNDLPLLPDLSNIIYDYIGNPFIITVDIEKDICIPSIDSELGFIIDWNDGIIEEFKTNKINL